MKKSHIFSVFTALGLLLALVIVACAKNAIEEPLLLTEQEQGLDAQLNQPSHEVLFKNFNAMISGIELPPAALEKVPSAQRGGDAGTNWLELAWFGSGSEGYVYLRPENLGNGCYGSISTTATNVQAQTYTISGTRINIQRGDEAVSSRWFNIPSSLQARYNAAFGAASSSLYYADYNAATSAWTVRFGALPPSSITITE